MAHVQRCKTPCLHRVAQKLSEGSSSSFSLKGGCEKRLARLCHQVQCDIRKFPWEPHSLTFGFYCKIPILQHTWEFLSSINSCLSCNQKYVEPGSDLRRPPWRLQETRPASADSRHWNLSPKYSSKLDISHHLSWLYAFFLSWSPAHPK
jgi:hypothetical protein